MDSSGPATSTLGFFRFVLFHPLHFLQSYGWHLVFSILLLRYILPNYVVTPLRLRLTAGASTKEQAHLASLHAARLLAKREEQQLALQQAAVDAAAARREQQQEKFAKKEDKRTGSSTSDYNPLMPTTSSRGGGACKNPSRSRGGG